MNIYLKVDKKLEKSWFKSLPFGRNTIYKKFGQKSFIFYC